MTSRRRSDRVKRLTVQGWKQRESAQLLVSSVAFDLRDALRANEFGDASEGPARFFQDLWKTYESMLSVDPAVPDAELREQLEGLCNRCVGALESYRPRLERAIAKLS